MYQLSSVNKRVEEFYPDPRKRWCNFGAPRNRTRTSRIQTTLFGDTEKKISWQWHERVGLIFEEGHSPLEYIENLLTESGFRSPDELRRAFEIPSNFLACRMLRNKETGFVKANSAPAEVVLRQALILGYCGPDFYDPTRPVIWTRSRLVRKLELYETGDFYADN